MTHHPKIRAIITLLIVLITSSLFTPAVSAAPSDSYTYQFLPNPYYTFNDEKVLFKIGGGIYSLLKVEWHDPQGKTAQCFTQNHNVCTTTWEYAPNNSIISGTWEFYISDQRPVGNYYAVVSQCTYYSLGMCLSWSEIWNAMFYIGPAPQAPVSATIPLGDIVRGVDVNPVTNRIYVANGANNLSVIDGNNNTVLNTVTVGTNPSGVGVNPATNRIYVANSGDYSFSNPDTVSVIDGANNTVIATVPVDFCPTGVGVNQTTNRVYVASRCTDQVTVINGADNTVITSVPVGTGPGAIAVNPTTNRVYVSNFDAHFISVIDGASNTVTGTVDLGDYFPWGVNVNPKTNRIYAAKYADSNTDYLVSVIDGVSNTLSTTVKLGSVRSYPIMVAANPTTNHVFAGNVGTYDVSVISGGSNAVLSTVYTGRPSVSIAVNPTTNRVYVANEAGNSLMVIQDTPDNGPTPDPNRSYVFLPFVVRPTP
jgi:YVTN family beta-propeller protein